MTIEFAGQYEKKQYLKAIQMAGKPKTWSTIWRTALFIALTGLVIALFISAKQEGDLSRFQLSRLSRGVIGIAALAYFIFMPYINIYRTANRLWNDPLVRRPIYGTVSGLGITYDTQTTPWDEFAFKHVSDDLVVLVTADRIMSALPRSFFRNEDDWQHFRQMIEQYVVVAR